MRRAIVVGIILGAMLCGWLLFEATGRAFGYGVGR
jgi:hypothetical protein